MIYPVTMAWMKYKDVVCERKQRDERGLLNEQAGQRKKPLNRFAVVVVWPYTPLREKEAEKKEATFQSQLLSIPQLSIATVLLLLLLGTKTNTLKPKV